MLEGRVQRTRAAGKDVRGQASETKTSPRSARRGPAPLTAPRSCEHRRSAAEVRTQGPPRFPARRRGPGPPPSRFPPNLGTARQGTKREGAPGAAAGRGVATPLGARREPLGGAPSLPPNPSTLDPCPPQPLSGLPISSPGPPPPGPAPCPLLFSRPCSRPSPGGGVPRSRLLRRASARPAGRRLMCPASPSPSPPPSPLLLLLFRRRRRLLQSTAEAKADPAAARTRGEAPAHCAPRWGRGRPAEAWERGARGTWH